jgi:predicted permease
MMINNSVPALPVKLQHFRALNGTQLKLYLLGGMVERYQQGVVTKSSSKRNHGRKKPVEHSIWMNLTDGRTECLRLNKFKELRGRVQEGQFLTLIIGTDGDRDDCLAIYNHALDRIFYRTEVWNKFLDSSYLLPVLLGLFVFPLLWLFIAMVFFRFGMSAKAVVQSPVMAAGICGLLYLGATLPVKALFKRHLKAILK